MSDNIASWPVALHANGLDGKSTNDGIHVQFSKQKPLRLQLLSFASPMGLLPAGTTHFNRTRHIASLDKTFRLPYNPP
jgi:hypothetical protein